ncbi:MAG: response regulator [Acetobacteraceae bacterium]|nr:response regulator [Acetobacteraceae bacterium]
MLEQRGERLHGRRLLVVEDEYLVAMDLAAALRDRGAEVIGPVGSVSDALALLAATADIDGAVLDINLRGQNVFPIADALRHRGVPFVFATGYDPWTIPDSYADVPRLQKPVNTQALARAVAKAV